MPTIYQIIILCVLLIGTLPLRAAEFITVDLFLNPGDTPLAVWQAELTYDPAKASIVGIEGPGKTPPTYDPAGLTDGRIILADFTTEPGGFGTNDLRVARLHVLLKKPTEFTPKLQVAADPDGTPIKPAIRVQRPPVAVVPKSKKSDKSDKPKESKRSEK